jgi:hypothetical protein
MDGRNAEEDEADWELGTSLRGTVGKWFLGLMGLTPLGKDRSRLFLIRANSLSAEGIRALRGEK